MPPGPILPAGRGELMPPKSDSARRAWGINAPQVRFCPKGVGALGGYDGSDLARSGSKTHRRNPPDTPSRRDYR
jgi:hypothetical protein